VGEKKKKQQVKLCRADQNSSSCYT